MRRRRVISGMLHANNTRFNNGDGNLQEVSPASGPGRWHSDARSGLHFARLCHLRVTPAALQNSSTAGS